MPNDPSISKVIVEGLHNQFDFEINLLPGLNVLYGKNGRGKTTLLHLLANLLELDFQRFSFLQFRRITVQTSRGDIIQLQKDEKNRPLKVSLNGACTSFAGGDQNLSEAEVAELRHILGPRPTYLPAFRSILERTRLDQNSMSGYRLAERRDSEFDSIMEREIGVQKELATENRVGSATLIGRQFREEAAAVGEKTTLCRQWFGNFVPVVRYPSVADVQDSLSEEWRRATFEISNREQRMFQETFVKIFRMISGLEVTPTNDSVEVAPTNESNEDVLKSISELLNDEDSQIGNPDSLAPYDRLVIDARALGENAASQKGVDRSLLDLYRKLLEARNTERRNAFQKCRDFEASINRFLDSKTLRIGRTQTRSNARSQVEVQAAGGQAYGLSALSSGERQILTMLYSASRTRLVSGIFLIDEPELSLHIDWQRIILRELQKQSPERQLIACTHSPEVGADHSDEIQDFEPRSIGSGQTSLFTDEEL